MVSQRIRREYRKVFREFGNSNIWWDNLADRTWLREESYVYRTSGGLRSTPTGSHVSAWFSINIWPRWGHAEQPIMGMKLKLHKIISIRDWCFAYNNWASLQFKEFHAKKQRCKASKEKELTQRTHSSLLPCSFAALRETPGSRLYSTGTKNISQRKTQSVCSS